MAANPNDASTHLDATLTAVETGVTALSPAAGRGMIERWLNVLADHPELNDVATSLGELREALSTQPIDGRRVGALLARLGGRTTQAARTADESVQRRLERLGLFLSQAGRRLESGAPLDTRQPGAGVPQSSTPSRAGSPNNPGRRARVADAPGDGTSKKPGTRKRPR